MPDSFTCLGIQGNQAICKEIVADAIGTAEIKCGGTCRNKDDSALGIERHPGPIVRSAAGLPSVLRPSAIPIFAEMGNRVKRPAQPSGSHVDVADVDGR